MSKIGDNGGPPAVPFTAKTKVECVKQLLERGDLTAAQKCIGAMMIVQADREWSAEMKTGELQTAASAKDRETVFRATRVLDEKGIISKSSSRGQSGKYVVLPPKIIEAVVEAYEDAKSSRVKADQSNQKWSGETGRHNQSASPPKAVGSMPTSRVNPVGFGPTTSQTSPAPAHAVSNNNIYNYNNNLPRNTPPTSEQVAARGQPATPAPSANAGGVSLREGETYLGHGVYVNCETIRHADFTISLLGIEMQLLGTVPMADIKAIATGHALQWALDLEAGKRNVVPSNTANFIRGSIQNRKNNDAVTDVRKARASSRHVPRPDGKSFADLNNEILAEIEQERRR